MRQDWPADAPANPVVEAELELRATFDAYAPAREVGPRGYDGPSSDLS